VNLFFRQAHDVIDWIRRSPGDKWRTFNIRGLRTRGVELGLERSFPSKARLELDYTFLQTDAGQIDYVSQYALDYARHSWGVSLSIPFPRLFTFDQTVNYRRRADGRSYCLLNGRLSRSFGPLSVDLDFNNLLNTGYQEVLGVEMPGRWITLTFSAKGGNTYH
jgi:outer membrane cobalamin receptor